MPRYSLKRSPWWTTTSPGRLVGAGEERADHHASAPAAIAFAMSPDEVRPPSAITGTPCRARDLRAVVDRGHLRDADARDDARRADRARPDAGLDARPRRRRSAPRPPRRSRCCRRSAGRRARLQPPHHLDDRERVAVRGVDDEHVDVGGHERLARARPRPARPRRRRRRGAGRARPSSRAGTGSRFEMSLTVISPRRRPSASTTGSFSTLWRCRISSASSSVVPTGAVTRLRAVMSAETGCACRPRSAGRGS